MYKFRRNDRTSVTPLGFFLPTHSKHTGVSLRFTACLWSRQPFGLMIYSALKMHRNTGVSALKVHRNTGGVSALKVHQNTGRGEVKRNPCIESADV